MRITNAAGSTVSPAAVLTVAVATVAPALQVQPQNLTATEGSTATFSASATGSAPLLYQWRRNGTDIAGATGASYTLASVVPGDHGAAFSVVVRNAGGVVTSNPAVLTVTGATAFPQGTVTLVVPFAAGGPTDSAARALAETLKTELGWTLVVSNTTGLNGANGMRRVATAPPDGHTLLVGGTEMATLPTLLRTLGIAPTTDFEHLGLILDSPMLLAGARSLPMGNYGTLATWLDGRAAGTVRFADDGIGNQSNLCSLLFAQLNGTNFSRVHYRGTAPALQALIGNETDLYCGDQFVLSTHVTAGLIRPFGVTTPGRSNVPSLAATPSLQEGGLANFAMTDWRGLYAPKGTPAAVVTKLNAALRTVLANTLFQNRIASFGSAASGAKVTPEGHRQFLLDETNRWRPLLQGAGEYLD